MIPKVIHYCWFGGNPLPEIACKCIDSWKKQCPDYKIIEWNETNFNLDEFCYVEEAYKAKKWAFVTDVVRLYVLVNYGGIYMDTDVEVVKPLDPFLNCEAFSGFESKGSVPTGIMAAEKGQYFLQELLADYKGRHFILEDGSFDLTTNVVEITRKCLENGLIPNNQKQIIKGMIFFPSDFFCPKDPETRVLRITSNTVTIHHFDGSWVPEVNKIASRIRPKLMKFMPKKIAGYVAMFIAYSKSKGIKVAIRRIFKR